MQGLTGVFSLKSQITAQERQNVDSVNSNTSLRKANVELIAEKKDFSSKLVELNSKDEELEENYVELIKGNAKIIGEGGVYPCSLPWRKISLDEDLPRAHGRCQIVGDDLYN